MKKVIVFDLDGTAIDSPEKKLPSKQLVEIIDWLKNKYYFSAATGRVWSTAKPILQALRLVDPCIISAGTQICDPLTGKILRQKTIGKKTLKDAVNILKNYPVYKLITNNASEDEYFYGGVRASDFFVKEPVYLLNLVFIQARTAREICARLNKVRGIFCVTVISQKPSFLDLHLVNSSATKEQAIAELLRLLKLNKQDTIGIGDGHNDIHIFKAVNYKVAMGNAVPELKAAADEIINPIKNDGMFKYLLSLANKT